MGVSPIEVEAAIFSIVRARGKHATPSEGIEKPNSGGTGELADLHTFRAQSPAIWTRETNKTKKERTLTLLGRVHLVGKITCGAWSPRNMKGHMIVIWLSSVLKTGGFPTRTISAWKDCPISRPSLGYSAHLRSHKAFFSSSCFKRWAEARASKRSAHVVMALWPLHNWLFGVFNPY